MDAWVIFLLSLCLALDDVGDYVRTREVAHAVCGTLWGVSALVRMLQLLKLMVK